MDITTVLAWIGATTIVVGQLLLALDEKKLGDRGRSLILTGIGQIALAAAFKYII